MSPAVTVLLIVTGVLLYLVGLLWLLRWIIGRTWRRLTGGRSTAEAYSEPGSDAVWKKYQSFSMGASNFGGSIHVAVDVNYLYLIPVKFVQIFGVYPISIPWSDVKDVRPAALSTTRMHAKINGIPVVGPSWCLELAAPDSQAGPGRIGRGMR